MSTKVELDLSDPWNRLQFAYENCTMKQLTEGHYGKYENGKLSVCGIGWALHASGIPDSELKPNLICSIKNLGAGQIFIGALRHYGLPKEERRKIRVCPMPDCASTGRLQMILEHLNECHKIPIRNIGKLVPIIRNDQRAKPTFADCCKVFVSDIKKLVS